MKAIKRTMGVLALFVTLPIWYYLLYQILVRVNASELMWFLFWVYVPLGMIISAATKIIGEES